MLLTVNSQEYEGFSLATGFHRFLGLFFPVFQYNAVGVGLPIFTTEPSLTAMEVNCPINKARIRSFDLCGREC